MAVAVEMAVLATCLFAVLPWRCLATSGISEKWHDSGGNASVPAASGTVHPLRPHMMATATTQPEPPLPPTEHHGLPLQHVQDQHPGARLVAGSVHNHPPVVLRTQAGHAPHIPAAYRHGPQDSHKTSGVASGGGGDTAGFGSSGQRATGVKAACPAQILAAVWGPRPAAWPHAPDHTPQLMADPTPQPSKARGAPGAALLPPPSQPPPRMKCVAWFRENADPLQVGRGGGGYGEPNVTWAPGSRALPPRHPPLSAGDWGARPAQRPLRWPRLPRGSCPDFGLLLPVKIYKGGVRSEAVHMIGQLATGQGGVRRSDWSWLA
jgi:hypothetical protein